MGKFYERLIGNSVFANVALVSVIALGVIAVLNITRESSPEVTIPMVEVIVPYPGADPEEVEEGISQKVEAAVDGLLGVSRYLTTSSEGMSTVTVEVQSGHDIGVVKDRVRNAVDSIQTFPEGAETPRVSQVINREEVQMVIVWGKLPERQLKDLAEEVRNELQALPEVSMVGIQSVRPYEISVEVPEQTLLKHGLTLADISQAIRHSSLNQSAGTIQLEGEEIRIRALGKKYIGPEFESIVVKSAHDGEVITLGQIADVRDTFKEKEAFVSFNGETGSLIDVYKASGEDAIEISLAVKSYIAEKESTLPAGAHISEAFDNTSFIKAQLEIISRNGLLGLLLVLFVLWLFLEARLAFWVAMGIPISLAGGVLLLWLVGASLNQISLVAMIVVMGIIVDDAIVVGEAIFVHRKIGKDPVKAAVDGIREVGLPVLASVSTTIVAFLPMAFIPGMFGEFSRQMPMVVVAALIVSLVECLFLLPAHLTHRRKRDENKHVHVANPFHVRRKISEGLEWFVEHIYGPVVKLAVQYRYVTLCFGISLILLTAGIIAGGHIKVTMWPGIEGYTLQARVEFPPGTPMSTVRDAVAQTQRGIETVASRIETKSGKPLIVNTIAYAPTDVDTAGSVFVEMLPSDERGISSDAIMTAWQEEVGEIPGALTQSFQGDSIGGGGGEYDVEFWLQGKDFDSLRAASSEFKDRLRRYEGVHQIADNFRPGKTELNVTLKPAAHNLGLTLQDVSSQLNAGYYGEEALRLQRGREEVYVRVRYPREERASLSEFEKIRIQTPQGFGVPILSVANINFTQGVSTISGINGVRGVRVSAKVDRNKANPAEINRDLTNNYMDNLVAGFPGVSWSISGAEQSNREIAESLQRNTLIAMMAIFVILCTIFRSYMQPFIIMLIIPYGVVGAIFGHMLLGLPLSFLSMGGITALAGVLVNDSIVLIERINTYLARGSSLIDAVCSGGKRRFRAIFLTSISTCVGLGPLIMERDLTAQIVIPMAVSIASGVAIGTMLTLVLIPAFLVIMNDVRRLTYRIIRGTWPTPEEVEPALQREVPEEEDLTQPVGAHA